MDDENYPEVQEDSENEDISEIINENPFNFLKGVIHSDDKIETNNESNEYEKDKPVLPQNNKRKSRIHKILPNYNPLDLLDDNLDNEEEDYFLNSDNENSDLSIEDLEQ